ncbi:MAG: GGDEF domain-containing protein [Proteobacteria bacterium]|nr:GGDEF domain-containing protein [Pseudomonadota bacterium]
MRNRALLSDRLAQALVSARRDGQCLAVMFHLDDVKPVNDNLGHDTGDLLLQQVATRLPRRLREADTLAEARKIGDAISTPFEIKGHSIAISASIGTACTPITANANSSCSNMPTKSCTRRSRMGGIRRGCAHGRELGGRADG